VGWLEISTRAQTPVNMLTYHNDNARTGQNLNETKLAPANVNTNSFGKLFSQPVDGVVYGQPLYLSQVQFTNHTSRNLVFIVTEHDSVYAFDADNKTNADSGVVWHVSFVNPAAGITTMPVADIGIEDPYTPEIGITSTPVIDPTTQTLYVVAKTKEPLGAGFYVFRLHALDVRTGAEKFGGPVVIHGVAPGGFTDADAAGNISFLALWQHQRAALCLANGNIYIGWASIGDIGTYHGWFMGYDAHTLQQTAVFNASPNGVGAGIWSSGVGPSADENGNLYVTTGNLAVDVTTGPNYSDVVLKLTQNDGGISVTDSFIPSNQAILDENDLDLSSGGILLLPPQPDTSMRSAIVAGKAATLYVLNRDNLGGLHADDSQIPESLYGAIQASFGVAAYFNGQVYYGAESDYLKAFSVSAGILSLTPTSRSAHLFGIRGTTPSISADGATNGIVWALDNSGFSTYSPAILHAYPASDLSVELYNSGQAGGRDATGPAVRFAVPTVANGKVYVATFNDLTVFGNSTVVTTPVITPVGGVFTNGATITITTATTNAVVHYTLDGSEPKQSSSIYSGPVPVTQTATVKARAFLPGIGPSDFASQTYYQPNAIGNGIGLRGDYYLDDPVDSDFPPTLTRLDPTIDFAWGAAPVDESVPAGSFSVHWSGQIQPQFSETYTFGALTSDGVRLWIGGQPVIDQWIDQPAVEATGAIDLVAGQRYDLAMDFYCANGGAVAQLFWSSPSTMKSIIPRSQLYPATNDVPWIALRSPVNGATYAAPANITLQADLSDPATLSQVQFGAGSLIVGALADGASSLTWSNVPPGSYTLTARASDPYGTVYQSAPTTVVVTGLPLQAAITGNEIVLSWPITPANYVLETATLLSAPVVWRELDLTTHTNANRIIATVNKVGASRFYRLHLKE